MTTPEQTPISIDQNPDSSWAARIDEHQLEAVVADELRQMEVALGEIEEISERTEIEVPRHFDFSKGARVVKDNRYFKKRAEKSRNHEASKARENFMGRQAITEALSYEVV